MTYDVGDAHEIGSFVNPSGPNRAVAATLGRIPQHIVTSRHISSHPDTFHHTVKGCADLFGGVIGRGCDEHVLKTGHRETGGIGAKLRARAATCISIRDRNGT